MQLKANERSKVIITRAEVFAQLAPRFVGRCFRLEPSTESLSFLDWHGLEQELRPHLGDGEVRRDGIGYTDGILSVSVGEQFTFIWTDLTFDFLDTARKP